MAGTSLHWRKKYVEEESNDHDDQRDEDDNVSRDLLIHVQKLSLGDNNNKPLLILDLNGLLIHRAYKYSKRVGDFPNNRPPDGIVGNHKVYRRPFCKEFMVFCLERFQVGIWSSAMERNIDGAMDLVFGSELRSKLLFVWNQSFCSDYGFKSMENKDKPLFFKELYKVWESREQWSKASFSAANTLLIDDKPYKGLLNPPNTGIFPNSYDAEDRDDNFLDPKGELGLFLKGLAEAEDVPSYVASHPFGQPAIKEGHPEWDFYSKILGQVNNKKGDN